MFTVIELTKRFRTRKQCLKYIEQSRWPDGVCCLRCGSVRVVRKKSGDKFQCKDCRYQFSATVGTIFHNSKVGLPKWFLAIHMILSSRKGYPAKQLSRDAGLPYKTCWSMLHRIRMAMANGDGPKLTGIVELDETYVKCKAPGTKGQKKTTKAGSDPMTHVVAFGMRQRGGEARIKIIPNTKQVTLRPIIDSNVRHRTMLHTDEWIGYRGLSNRGFRHHSVCHSEEYVADDGTHCNGVESLWAVLKRGRYGVYHKIGRPYAQRYVDEVSFRINHNGSGFPALFARCEKGFNQRTRSANPRMASVN